MKALLEKISNPAQSSFSIFHYSDREFDAPWHFHPEFELTYIKSSSGMRYVGDSVMEFESGDLVLLGPNLPHCWKNTDTKQEMAQSIVLQWKHDLLGEGWTEKPEFRHISKLLSQANKGLRFDEAIARKVRPVMEQMLRLAPYEKMIALLQILQQLARNTRPVALSGEHFTPNLNHKANERIALIHNFIRDNYQRQISLREVAETAAMGEESFCRFFKKNFNKPFFVFLNEYKVKLVCKQLLESEKNVTETAYDCGYESLPYFYRQFKKFIGCSPLTYRKKFSKAFSK